MNIANEIKVKVSIIELLNHLKIQPNKSGFIKSIYKDERVPSLKIYPETNSFYCFSTGRGGSIIDFYKDYFNIPVKDAIRELAQIFNIQHSKL